MTDNEFNELICPKPLEKVEPIKEKVKINQSEESKHEGIQVDFASSES